MTDRTLSNPAHLRHPGRVVAALCASVTLLCAASCGGTDPDNGDGPTDPSPTNATTSGTTEPTPIEPTNTEPASVEDKAAAALLGYLDIRDKAYATGRISKKLNKYATGQEHFGLQQFVMSLNQPPKTHFEGEWMHEVVRTESGGADTILVTDCQDASGVALIRDQDGTELPWFTNESGAEIPRRLFQVYRVVLSNDVWKVESGASNPNRPEEC